MLKIITSGSSKGYKRKIRDRKIKKIGYICKNEEVSLWLTTSSFHEWFHVCQPWDNGRRGLLSRYKIIFAN